MPNRMLADETTGAVDGGLAGILGELNISIGGLRTEMRKQHDERYEIGQNIYPIEIPIGTGTVNASGVLSISSAELFGPRTGKVWDVRRITVSGLASSTETVQVLRQAIAGTSFPNMNVVTSLTGPTGTFSPSGLGLIVRAGYNLVIHGTSLTNNEVVTVNWDAIEISEPWLGAYLL